ncbi:hypothetical protein CNMCM8694_001447 [Aspergillus lentulus]|nr:hypothetical protein CNMCM8694_001447 [Aspergillus lentulus]
MHEIYDQDESYVICDDVPLLASLQLTPLTKRDNGGCFTQTVNSRSLQSAAEAFHFEGDSFLTGSDLSDDAEFETADSYYIRAWEVTGERQFLHAPSGRKVHEGRRRKPWPELPAQAAQRQHELRKHTILLSRKPAIQIVHDWMDSECVRGRVDSRRILRDRAGRRAIEYVIVQWRPSYHI